MLKHILLSLCLIALISQQPLSLANLTASTSIYQSLFAANNGPTIIKPTWQHLSTVAGDLPLPSANTQQTASLVGDLDLDGINDFVIGSRRTPGPALVWYQRNATGWTKHLIEAEPLRIEAGGTTYDIDGDGDLDIVLGGDNRSNQLWWWENPYPNYAEANGWQRHLIKDRGANKHHDQIFGDFDGDGQAELVFWNQQANALLMAPIPADPRTATTWPTTAIYTYVGIEHEGLAKTDINGDGLLDIVGGGRWFQYIDGLYKPQIIDDNQRFSRTAAGQLIPGGRPEIVFVCGDCMGPLRWYEWNGTTWQPHDLLPDDVDHGHTLELGDVNNDGTLDIFVAEMRVDGTNPTAAAWFFLGDGAGNFQTEQMTTGFGHHESRLADLDGDGDLDILGKPYNWETPRLDIWLNQTRCTTAPLPTLDQWRRHLIDEARPWRAIFVDSADINQDGYQDIVSGGWWYANPGTPAGTWLRTAFGERLNNLAIIADFDHNGTPDLLGTAGQGSKHDATLHWAQNDGAGNFIIHDNIAEGDGDFLQGVTILSSSADVPQSVVLSWHDEGKPLQQLTVPGDPAAEPWPVETLSTTTQAEEITAADIDRDGDLDLMLGTKWLRNEQERGWTAFTLAPATMPATARPDRHRLADLNGDGRLDVVIGFEGIGEPARLAWYAQPVDATTAWTEELIDEPVGPMSLDLRDMDGDGDSDLVVGEHRPDDPRAAGLYIYENIDGKGGSWQQHLVYRGDEHHDGAQTVDIDNDGDWDIISIGWKHDEVLLYENRTNGCRIDQPTPVPTVSPSVTATPTTAQSSATPTARATLTATTTPPNERITPDVPMATATVSATSTPQATPTVTDVPQGLPIIKRQPKDSTIRPGDDVTFEITVNSSGTTTYQWHRNDAPIPNAQQLTYTLTNVTLANHEDRFFCVVTNGQGAVQSEMARLQVIEPGDDLPVYRAYLPHIVQAN